MRDRVTMRIKSVCLLALVIGLYAAPAQAQLAVNPASVNFSHPPAEFDQTASYHVDFFQCTSVGTGGVCVGRAAGPFQTGFDVPKSQVTNATNERVISLQAPPASGVLAAMPTGVAFVISIQAIGDPAVGASGISARSPDTPTAFIARGRTPAAPTLTHVVQ